MWFVKYGNEYLHDPRIGLILPTTKPTVELNTSTPFEFTLAYNHPLYNVIRERDPDNAVVVYQGHDIVYRGEISNIELDFKLTKKVTCTSDLGFFNGSILRPYSTISGECSRTCPSTVDGYFDFLVKEHNKQSSIVRQFKMGINNGDQIYPNNYIYRADVDYPTVGATIKDNIIESLGGYLRVRYEEDGTYIDLLSDMPDVNAQVIDFGVNLLDYTDETNSEDIASFVVPVGKDIEKAADDTDTLANKLTISKNSIPYLQVVVDKRTAERKETNDSLYSANQSVKEAQQNLAEAQASGDAEKIKSAEERLQSAQEQAQTAQEKHDAATEALELAKSIVSDAESATVDRQIMEGYHKSGDIIYSDEAVKKYGWIGAMVDYSDITVVSNLIIYGLISLKSLESPVKTITLSAFDLSMIDPDADPIKLGEYVRVRSKPHGVDSYFLCTKIEYDLNNPSNNKFTLGTTFDTLTGQQNRRIKALNATINNVYEAAAKISEEAKAASKMATDALQQIASLDGKYIHIKYSANSDGSNMTTTPTGDTKYIGIYSGGSETAPTDASFYAWSLIKGSDGVGVKGEDGKSAYLHIKYSNDGKTFTGNDGEDPGDWIGTCADENEADPTGFEAYTWKLIKGEDGEDGKDGQNGEDGKDGVSPEVKIVKSKNYSTITITDKNGTHTTDIYDGENGTPGEPGEDGKTTYFHVKYSDDGGKTFTSNSGEDPGAYLGTCTDYAEADPTNVSSYTWVKIKGEDGARGLQGLQGEKGEQGVPGTDGQSTYFHIKYSDIANPTSSSQMTETPSTYIGTYVDFTETDSTDPTKYTWSQFKGSQGDKGDQGIAGTNGIDGKTMYLHIAYANSADGKTGFDVSDSGNKLYIGQYTDFNPDDSTDPTKYTWTKIKGEDGNGIESTSVTYQASTSGSSIPTGTWRDKIPTLASGQYLWTRTITTYTDGSSSTSYSVGMIGKNGSDGVGVRSTEVTYQAGSSATSVPTGEWLTTLPTPSSGTPYIWTRTITTYTNDTTSTSYNVGCTPEGIQVGGRNLLLQSRTLDGDYYTRNNASLSFTNLAINGIVYDVAHMQREFTGSGQYSDYRYTNELKDLKANTAYTLSFWAKGNGIAESFLGSHIKSVVNSDGFTGSRFDGRSMITLTDDWKRYWITWITADDFAEATTRLSILYTAYSTTGHATEWYMYAPKFEIGNKTTDWTPAPEDVDSDLKNLDTNIRDTIADVSKDTLDASKDMMDDKLNDYVQNGTYDSFKQSVEAKLEVMDSDITMNFNTVTESINNVDSSLNTKFSELTKYIRFSNDGIEIGASENELKLSLDNDIIRFTKNGEPIGWWDGNDFHTGNLVVEVNEHAQFGNFSFVPRSDGSLMFLKVKD